MVLAAKVFLVRGEIDLDGIALKLRDMSSRQELEILEQRLELLTEVGELSMGADWLEGVFSYDQPIIVKQRGKEVPTIRTISAPFLFNAVEGKLLLTIFEKKPRANSIANAISKALFLSAGGIVEARIGPEILRRYHEDNFDDTKVVFFDNVDLPNVSKLSLYGEVLGNTSLYSEYLQHGDLWYVVVKSRRYGYVVGLTRNLVVTVFTRIGMEEFKTFIKEEIIPLIP